MTVAVVTDSTSCLTLERAERAGVCVVPLHVHVDGQGRLAGREIRTGDVAEILRGGKQRVTTSGVAPGEFVTAYRRLAERTGCGQVVSVHLSGAVSATVEAARLARAELAGELEVHVVDSQVLGMALGYAACSGARAAASGAGAEEVVAAVLARAGAGRTWFYVDTLEHLRRGGRIGRARAVVGSALAIKPLLTIRDGEVASEERVRTRAKALARLVEHAVAAVERAQGQGREVELAVHELGAREAGEDLAEELRGRTGITAEVVELDPVVGVHTGPGTLGVVVAPLP